MTLKILAEIRFISGEIYTLKNTHLYERKREEKRQNINVEYKVSLENVKSENQNLISRNLLNKYSLLLYIMI